MEKSNSISELTYKLKNIARDIRETISEKGILDRNNVKDDLSLFSGYIRDTIISDFENTLKNTFSYPQAIVDYINERFSLGGYYFYKKFQEPRLQEVEGSTTREKLEKIVIPDTQEIREIFSSSRIKYTVNGVEKEYDIAYFPILNLTAFSGINTLFKNNRIVIGLPKIIYDGGQVPTLAAAFFGCSNLHYINLKATGESPSMVSFNNMFYGCIVLEDFNVENIIPTNITSLARNNDIQVSALEKLDLTHITSVDNLVYTFSKTNQGAGFIPNLYMPRCMNAEGMLTEGRWGCGNLTFGVGCKVNVHTFCKVDASPNVGIISGLTSGVNLTKHSQYNAQSVHNWLYSVATDVRTYGHPNDSNPEKVRKLTFHADAITRYNASEIKTKDETNEVYIQDTLTDENTLNFSVEDNELDSLNAAIKDSESLKKPLELYDAIYNKNNNTRYYITALDGETVAMFNKCTFTIDEDKGKEMARLAEGTIFDLMAERYWTYG